MIRVTSVMPEMGLLPVIAVASAATVVNRKAKMKAMIRPVTAICGALPVPAGSCRSRMKKKRPTAITVSAMPPMTVLIFRSRSVRTDAFAMSCRCTSCWNPSENDLAIVGMLRMIPMRPAPAIAPTPTRWA